MHPVHEKLKLNSHSDVIKSFLSRPDPFTDRLGLLERFNVQRFNSRLGLLSYRPVDPHLYQAVRRRYLNAAGATRYWFTAALYFAFILTIFLLKYQGDSKLQSHYAYDLTSLRNLGFGQTSPLALVSLPKDTTVTAALLIANLPQLFVSLLHLNYNSFYTCVLLEKEWNAFALHRSTLRVSTPNAGQRSTYFLTLPYRYAIPLMSSSGLMHYLASESIFLARVRSFSPSGNLDDRNSITGCGYSPIPILCMIALAFTTGITTFAISKRKFRAGMPFAGHCSAVISAACHRLPTDAAITTKPIQYGIVSDEDGIAHCAFSSLDVKPLEEGQLVR